jgi:hypothetical protein
MIVTPSYSIPKGVNSGIFSIIKQSYTDEIEMAIDVAKTNGWYVPLAGPYLPALNRLIIRLKDTGIMDLTDIFYNFSTNHQSSLTYLSTNQLTSIALNNQINQQVLIKDFIRINLKNPYKHTGQYLINASTQNLSVMHNGLVKAVGGGNTTEVFNTNYNVGTDSVTYTLDNASFSGFLLTGFTDGNFSSTGNAGFIDGITSVSTRFNPWNASNRHVGVINGTLHSIGPTVSTAVGHHSFERDSSSSTRYYRNGISVGTAANVSTSITPAPIYLYSRYGGQSLCSFRMGANLDSKKNLAMDKFYREFLVELGIPIL